MSRYGLYSLPDGWEARAVMDCILPKGVENKGSIQQRGYQPSGRFPVVDQGAALVAGYTDEETMVYQQDLPLILFGDHTRVFKFLDFPFATGADGTKLLKPNREFVDAKFLYYALLKLEIPSRGYNRHFKYLKEREVPCPSDKAEQRAIAAVLSKIQAAIEVQQRIVATLKALKAATMAKLFREGTRGEKVFNESGNREYPSHWDLLTLQDCAYVQTGIAKGRRLRGDDMVERPYLRVANVQDGYLDLGEIKTILLQRAEIERYSLRAGDVLLTEGGDFDKLGRGYIWREQIEGCVHQNHIFAVRTNKALLVPEFFAYLIQSPYGKAYFLSVAHKTTNLACINSTKLRTFPVILPEIEEQNEIAGVLNVIDFEIEAQSGVLTTKRTLFSSMLHLLMTGQVRVNHLNLQEEGPVWR